MTGRDERAQRPPDPEGPASPATPGREPLPPGEEPEAGDLSPADPDRPTDDVRVGNILVEPTPGD